MCPNDPYNIAVSALQKQHYKRANQLFLELNEDHPFTIEYMRGLSISYLGVGNTGDAERIALQMFDVSPSSVETLETLARIRLAQENLSEADELAKEAYRIAPYSTKALLVCGLTCNRMGNPDAGFFFYKRAYEIEPDSIPILYAVSLQCLHLKKTDVVFSIILNDFKKRRNIRTGLYLSILYCFTTSRIAKLLRFGSIILAALFLVANVVFTSPYLLFFPFVFLFWNFLLCLTAFLDPYLNAKRILLFLTAFYLMAILLLIFILL